MSINELEVAGCNVPRCNPDSKRRMTMTTNMGTIDRALRAIGGLALLAWALLGTGEWHVLGWIGIVPLATAAIGWCPLYTLIGVSTCPAKKT
jgi:hypothetical protein